MVSCTVNKKSFLDHGRSEPAQFVNICEPDFLFISCISISTFQACLRMRLSFPFVAIRKSLDGCSAVDVLEFQAIEKSGGAM